MVISMIINDDDDGEEDGKDDFVWFILLFYYEVYLLLIKQKRILFFNLTAFYNFYDEIKQRREIRESYAGVLIKKQRNMELDSENLSINFVYDAMRFFNWIEISFYETFE